MDTTSVTDEFRRYLALFWHWGWLIALLTILSMAIALLISIRTTPVYQATAKVLINEAPATKSNDYTSILTSERLAQTYTQLMVSEAVLTGVISELKLNMTPSQLNKSIQVDPVRDTQLIQLSANNTDPVKAAMILDELIDTFINEIGQIQSQRFEKPKESLQKQLDDMEARINVTTGDLEKLINIPANREERDRLEQNLTQLRQIYSNLLLSFEQIRLAEAQATNTVVRVEDPSIPTFPVLPRTTTNVVLAGLVGFMFSCGLVLLIEAFDDTIKGPDDVTRHLGLPVLGMIARYDKDVKLITSTQPRSPIAEAYRSIRTNLQFASIDKPIHTLVITSPSPEDGKSSVASNLGIVMAQSGRKVTLIDADLRRPNLHKILVVPNRKGITSLVVQSNPNLDGCLHQTSVPNLWVVTAGDSPPNPSELLGSSKMNEVVGKIKESMDIVLIDTPPILVVTDSAVLAPRVDGVILVVKPGSTNLGAAKQAIEQLRRVGANILGIVLNGVNVTQSRYRLYRNQGYYYQYSNYANYDSETEKNGKGEKIKLALGVKNGKDHEPNDS